MLRITCAIIQCNEEILIAQRSQKMLLPLNLGLTKNTP